MRRARPAALLAATVLLAACGPADNDETATPEDDPTTEEPPEDAPAPDLEQPEAPEFSIEDGVFRGVGVILPVVEDWEVDEAMLPQGLVAMGPAGDTGREALVAAAGIEANPMLGFEGLDYDGTLELVRQLDPAGEPEVDESVELSGASQAQLIVFRDVQGPEDLPDTDTFVLVADDGEGQLAMFNYSAESGSYDQSVEDEVVAAAGFDPDSEPVVPDMVPPGDPMPDEGELEP